ncbi:hypothetical protein BJX61DRAFT_538808 [Aspergillus egyptiacus]|nr:hypothetical protein BJX61DRAFT_538808 [Aspergillus egyptiacus]
MSHTPRQRPGSACEECRRRKVRCDRQRPQCQVCYESGIECKISTARLPRGPRKGQLRTLRTRIAALERFLAEQHPEINQQMNALVESNPDCDSDDDILRGMKRESTEPPEYQHSYTKAPPSPISPRSDIVSELMRADLYVLKDPFASCHKLRIRDQLYFDRVHPFAPILQRWRYHVWSKQHKKSHAQICLQYAMWTVSASLSAQFRSLREPLYYETRRMLDSLDSLGDSDASASVEEAQAWVLICVYEYMCLSPLQAWMSAGRCCRLVLGMRLYELDDPNNTVAMVNDPETSFVDWTGLEERRRTFWMAYSLDRFISFHNGLPFTLNERLIATRLPCREEEFQAGHPVVTQFLPEAMMKTTSDDVIPISSFGECVVLATICGRALSHRQKVAVEQINPAGDAAAYDGFWKRHRWLQERINDRIETLSSSPQVDPMLMFTRIFSHTIVLFLHCVLESITWKTGDHLLRIFEHEQLCAVAAHEVVNLIKLQCQLGQFQVHPLTPIPLMMCTEFLASHSYLDIAFDAAESHVPGQAGENMDTSAADNCSQGNLNEHVVLVFGCQWLSFTASDFRHLRATVLDNPEHHWMVDVLGELPGYYRDASTEEYLPSLRTIQGGEGLRDLDRWIRCDDTSTAKFPLSYTQLAPLLMMTHFVQYGQYLKLGRTRNARGSEMNGQSNSQRRVVEVVGFCIGFLSGVVVTAAQDEEDLKRLGAVALRLAMLLGALGDVQEAEEKYTSLATMWRSSELKSRLNGILEGFPGSYITVQYDENRTTIMTPRRKRDVLQQALQTAGFSANPVEFNGRYHCAANEKHLPALFALCESSPGLQLPDAKDLKCPPRSNTGAELVRAGPLHQLVLRAILTQPCLWHQTFSALYREHLMYPRSLVVEFGPEKCVPPSFLRRLPKRVIYFADLELPHKISRDYELATRPPAETDIAIVGMACRVAGADDLDEFWRLLCSGECQHREMPRERSANYETPWRPGARGRPWLGNFVKDIDAFDHKFFRKSPREAMSQDPQQRLILQVAYQALESAGYFSRPPAYKDIGCYIASCTVDYEHNVNCHPATAYAATGLLRSFLAGKLSHYFGWRGPSLCVDTACSGSAVALHHACRAILNGDCTAALVGGANAIMSPLAYDNLAGASFLSPTGACKSFDAKADGYCRGEGFAAIYVKKLSDALASGDTILATIAATAVEQNDNCTPIVVPDAASLAGLFEKVTCRARLHPRDITVVEAHGTGTQAGDPAEYLSVRQILGGAGRAGKLSLGSVKALVGHTEGASGLVALCKVVLMIHEGKIPPQPGFHSLNPHIKTSPDDHIEIGTSLRPWKVGFRAALINNYGACGSNASMVITQGPYLAPIANRDTPESNVALPFRLCALDRPRIKAYAARLSQYISHLYGKRESFLANIAYNVARQSNPNLECQYILRARSLPELTNAISKLESGDEEGLVHIKRPHRPVILCFGGQVGRSVGLDRGLYNSLSLLRHHLDACDTILQAAGQDSIYPGIFSTSPIPDTVQLHTQLFAMQYACARCWIDSGVPVAAVVGHSFGELTAFCISEVLSLSDALTVIVRRATLIRDKWGADLGGMLAVEGDENFLAKYLEGSSASIACFNGPRSFTVAGPTLAIDGLQREVEINSALRIKRLDITNAFHSALVDPLLPALQKITDGLTLNCPAIPLERATISRSDGVPPASFVASHLRQPVYFREAVQRLAAHHGPAIWLEAGSNSAVTSIVRKSLHGNSVNHAFHSVNISGGTTLESLTETTIGLWKDHIPCSFWGHHPLQSGDFTHLFLPPYQFEKSRHWMENQPLPNTTGETQKTVPVGKEELIFSFAGYEDLPGKPAKYRIHTDHPRYVGAVSGHVAAKTAPIAPASLLLDYAVELLRSLPEGKGKIPSVRDVESDAPLLLDSNREVWMEILARRDSKSTWDLKFNSQDKQAGSSSRLLHCTAHITLHDVDDGKLQAEFARYARLVSHGRCMELLTNPDVDDILQGRNVYRSFAEIVEYSEQYRGVQKLVGRGNESAGRVVKAYSGETWADAFLVDSFSQCGGFWINCMTDRSDEDIYIASAIEKWMRTPAYADMATRRPDTWHVWARHQRAEGWYTSDVFVFTHSGELVEMFLGLRYSRVSKSLFIRLLGGSVQKSENRRKEKVIEQKTTCSDLPSRIRAVVAEFCAVQPSEVKDDSHLADAGVDSLMAMELARELEQVFNCTLAVEALLEADTFSDLVRVVQAAVGDDGDGAVSCRELSAAGSSAPEDSERLLGATESVTTISDTPELALPNEYVLQAFGETKLLTDQFLAENQCSGRLHEFTPLLVKLCVVLTLEAFEDLGSKIRTAQPSDRLGRIQFDKQHESLVDYLYNRLVEAMIVRLEGLTVVRTEATAPTESSSDLLDRIENEYPEYAGASKLTFYTGSRLASVLRGKQDGLQLIFGTPEGQQLVSWMYGEEPHNVAGYKLMGEFIRRLVQKLSSSAANDGVPLRILEMGAGTGGGTKWFLPLLAALPIPVEYTFSDISSAFLAQAKRKFREYPFIRYCLHDIEKPPAEELRGTQHIIIASNAVHATANLVESTSNMRQALRPDGVLMMLEMTKPVFAIDLVFGLFRGWWVFNDGRTHAITSEDRWEKDLHAAGYGHVDWTDGESNEVSVQRVIFATAGGTQRDMLPVSSGPHETRLSVVEEHVRVGIAGFTPPSLPPQNSLLPAGACVLVTGGTGNLGSHLVAHLVRLQDVQTVVCLNRISKMNPQQRQLDALEERQLHLSAAEQAKLVILESDTATGQLGLSPENYTLLRSHVTHIIHNAWPMNGMKPLSSVEGQFRVMRNLIDLAREISAVQPEPVRFQFISSIGTVGGGGALEERTRIEKVMANGYNEAKFVCERMLQETLQRYPDRFQASIIRPGQIVGSEVGYWNTSEHFPSMVKLAQSLGFFPALEGKMAWIPVDAAARSMAELLLDQGIPEEIYHIDNPVGQDWASVVNVLAEEVKAVLVPFKDWLQRVRQVENSPQEIPAGVMADWLEGNFERMSCRGPLDTRVARKHSKTLREMERDGEIGEEMVRTFVRRWRERHFLT